MSSAKFDARRAAVRAWLRAYRAAAANRSKSTAVRAWENATAIAEQHGPEGCGYALGWGRKLVQITRRGTRGALYGRVVYKGRTTLGTERAMVTI